MEKRITKVLADLTAKVVEGNELIKDKKPITTKLLDSFAELEKEYASLRAKEVYAELGKADKPMEAAVRYWKYSVKKVKTNRDKDTKDIVSFELIDKSRDIDLLKFAKQNKLPTDWQYRIMELNQLLGLRTVADIGFSKAKIAEFAKTIYMAREAKRLDGGKVSNNQLTQKVQEIIDSVLVPEDDEAGNVYKCNNHDVKYLMACYARKGNGLSIRLANDGTIRNLMLQVMHRIVENKEYDAEYRRIKEKAAAKVNTSAESSTKDEADTSKDNEVVTNEFDAILDAKAKFEKDLAESDVFSSTALNTFEDDFDWTL